MNTCLQRHSRLQNRGRQRGASLIIIVLMVLAMALTTLTAFHLSSNQYRLVANLQHIEQAFNRPRGLWPWVRSGSARAITRGRRASAASTRPRRRCTPWVIWPWSAWTRRP